jgi:hypothetical protein
MKSDGFQYTNSGNAEQLRPSQSFPNRQFVFFTSGCLAGIATLPVEFLISRASVNSGKTSWRQHLPKGALAATTVFRAGVRFCIFDITRTILDRQVPRIEFSNIHTRTAFIGGLSGASGGFAEVFASSLVSGLVSGSPRFPTLGTLASQSTKLFFCFGTYTFISSTFSREYGLPPKPFPVALMMGATAGGVGSAILAAIEGARGLMLGSSALRGALVIGTVISVHVTTCAEMLHRIDG